MNTTTTPSPAAVRRMFIIQTAVWLLIISAMTYSATHVFTFAGMLGAQSFGSKCMAVALVDIVVLVGKISMYHEFEGPFRRSGLVLVICAGSCSLAANIGAGETLGDKIIGALSVLAWLALETHAERGGKAAIKSTPAPARRKMDPAVAADRAAKSAATKARRKAEREAAAEAERWANLTPAQRGAETRARRAAAPVSGAGMSA